MPYADPERQREHNRRYYQEHRAEAIARATEWNRNNPEKRAATVARWDKKNPDYRRKWYAANREAVLARTAASHLRRLEQNPDHVRAVNRERAARRRALQRAVVVEFVDSNVVWERDRGLCGICGEAVDRGNWHLDHIIPIAKGGAHSYLNVQVAHPLCNQRKGAT